MPTPHVATGGHSLVTEHTTGLHIGYLRIAHARALAQASQCRQSAHRAAKGLIPQGSTAERQSQLAFSNRVQAAFHTHAARRHEQALERCGAAVIA
jgi:hypothetical protein